MTLAHALTCLALVTPAARAHGVSPTLAAAVAHVESGCRGPRPMGGVTVRVGVVSLRNRLRANRVLRALAVYNAGNWRSARGQRYARLVLRVEREIVRVLRTQGEG